jgi:hypothetical protein
LRLDIESDQDAIFVGEISDQPPHRQRQLLDECRSDDHRFRIGKLRLLVNVHDFQKVAPVQLLLAEGADILDRADRGVVPVTSRRSRSGPSAFEGARGRNRLSRRIPV